MIERLGLIYDTVRWTLYIVSDNNNWNFWYFSISTNVQESTQRGLVGTCCNVLQVTQKSASAIQVMATNLQPFLTYVFWRTTCRLVSIVHTIYTCHLHTYLYLLGQWCPFFPPFCVITPSLSHFIPHWPHPLPHPPTATLFGLNCFSLCCQPVKCEEEEGEDVRHI